MKRIVVSWSSGKDSTLSLLRLLEDDRYDVVGLFTTYVENTIPFQETSLQTISLQAERLGLPLVSAELPEVFPENPVYQSIVVNALKSSDLNIEGIAFGDMFCNGIEDYRRSFIEPAGLECVFPILGESSADLAREIIHRKIEARVLTVDTNQLDGRFVGQAYTEAFIQSLPEGVDPCGEDGEFHTLVTNTPRFTKPINIDLGDIDRSGRFHIQKYELKNNN